MLTSSAVSPRASGWLLLAAVVAVSVLAMSDGALANDTSYIGQRVVRFHLLQRNGRFAFTSDDSRDVELRVKSRTLELVESWAKGRGLDVWARNLQEGWIDVRVPSEAEFDGELERLALSYRVMIPDLHAAIIREREDILVARKVEESFFGTYRTIDEFNKYLEVLVRKYPGLATKKMIGKTFEGRPMHALVIGAQNRTQRARLVISGGQHGREWISPMTNAYIADQLLSLYGTDAEVTKMVDLLEWSIIPIVNPDGYEYSWTSDRLWKNNRRPLTDGRMKCYGVDTNCNWGMARKPLERLEPCNDTFCGAEPLSELETKAIADYINSLRNVKGYIDFHSYSQTWVSGQRESSSSQHDLSLLAVDAIKAKHGKAYSYDPGRVLDSNIIGMTAAGWTHEQANVTWSYEVGLRDTFNGFLTPASEIVPTGEEVFAAVRVMANRVLEQML